jgi:hypothetical protein
VGCYCSYSETVNSSNRLELGHHFEATTASVILLTVKTEQQHFQRRGQILSFNIWPFGIVKFNTFIEKSEVGK